MIRKTLGLALIAAAAASPALAAPVRFERISEDAYQSFVVNWTPSDAPLCAAIASADAWNTVFHPAAVMGPSKPFGPDATFWRRHIVVLIARVLPGDSRESFGAPSVRRSGSTLIVSYVLRPPSRPASYMGKAFLALALPRTDPATVAFRENGRSVCTVHPASGAWVSPAPAPGA